MDFVYQIKCLKVITAFLYACKSKCANTDWLQPLCVYDEIF